MMTTPTTIAMQSVPFAAPSGASDVKFRLLTPTGRNCVIETCLMSHRPPSVLDAVPASGNVFPEKILPAANSVDPFRLISPSSGLSVGGKA